MFRVFFCWWFYIYFFSGWVIVLDRGGGYRVDLEVEDRGRRLVF